MPLTLDAGEIVELAWWWEEPPRGRLLDLREVSIVRALVGRWFVRAGQAGALRGFFARGEAGEVGRFEDAELFERIAVGIVRGRIKVGVAAREALIAWDGEEEEAPAGERVVVAPKLVEEKICWPCLMKELAAKHDAAIAIQMAASASARILREAAKSGTPFIADG